MAGILVTFKDANHLAAIKAAASTAGMTDRGWCRHMLLAAAGVGRPDPMIVSGEEADAIAGLVTLGMDEATAKTRVAAVLRKHPGLNASQIIANAYKEN